MAREGKEKAPRVEYGRKLVPWVELERKRGHWEGTEVDVPVVTGDTRVWCGPFSVVSPEQAVAEALRALGLADALRPGQLVAIKVNLGGGLAGCPGSFTDPELVRGIVRWARSGGARPVVVEGDPRACRADARLLRTRGYDTMLLDEGASFESLAEGEWARVTCRELEFPLDVPTLLLDPGVFLVNAYAPKYHWECGVTLAAKNLYGALRSSTKGDYHRRFDRIDRVIAAAARILRPAVSIGGGTFFGSGLGPHFTVPVRIDRIAAHRDVVRGDRFWCDVLDYPWREIEHLRLLAADADPAYELVSGATPLDPSAVSRIRAHRITPSGRARWKSLLWPQYFVPHSLQRALYPLAEPLASLLNRAVNHPKGDRI